MLLNDGYYCDYVKRDGTGCNSKAKWRAQRRSHQGKHLTPVLHYCAKHKHRGEEQGRFVEEIPNAR